MRQDNDYGDFLEFQKEDILPLVNKAEEFINIIEELIQK